jgi:cob(I)alamin adenosyltransferase
LYYVLSIMSLCFIRGTRMKHIYTGEGKGKTTAAIGLAIRAAGAGQKVLFAQVIKKGDSSEISVLEGIPKITVRTFGDGDWIVPGGDAQKEIINIQSALMFVNKNINNFQVVIIDELISAIQLKLITTTKALEFIKAFPEDKELVLTGHGASKRLKEVADLVTEMKEVKHYYQKGTKARKGIEL